MRVYYNVLWLEVCPVRNTRSIDYISLTRVECRCAKKEIRFQKTKIDSVVTGFV